MRFHSSLPCFVFLSSIEYCPHMNKSIFFDLDGTLWNALVTTRESYNEIMEEENLPYRYTLDFIESITGRNPELAMAKCFPDLSKDRQIELYSKCQERVLKNLSAHPGIIYQNESEVLEELGKKYPLYIVSNCKKSYIENYLCGNYHMEMYFRGHICVGDTGKEKYENIRFLMENLGFDDVIYVGDTPLDLEQARKANVRFIHAAYGFEHIEEENVPSVMSIDELPSKVEEVFAL